MEKEYFYNLYNKIVVELNVQFNLYSVEVIEYKAHEDENSKLFRCEAIIRLKTNFKYLSLWMRNSTSANKPFSIIIAIGDNNSDYSISLTDYIKFRNIEFDENLLFRHLIEFEDAIEVSKQLFKRLKELIETEELQKLLYTDYQIEVPRDYSPYK